MSDALSEFEVSLLDNVATSGCHINGVFDPDGEQPDFAYSTGFSSTVKQPEVIIFGLDLSLMHALINDTLSLCKREFEIAEYATTEDLIEGFSCVFRKVHPDWMVSEYWASAIWYNRIYLGQDFDAAFQIVWPDKENRFPWDADVSPSFVTSQPALYEPRLPQ